MGDRAGSHRSKIIREISKKFKGKKKNQRNETNSKKIKNTIFFFKNSF
jgi:hypothetical protein